MSSPIPVPSDSAQRVIAYPYLGPPGRDGENGEQGPQGPPGPAGGGPSTFWGQGPPPDVIPGAHPGDRYIDELTGDTYTLN